MLVFYICIFVYLLSMMSVYLISALSEEYDDCKLDNDEKWYALIPGVSVYLLLLYFSMVLKDFFGTILDMIEEIPFIERWLIKRKQMKIRKDKIKSGIIRITCDDPYGEENWD